MWRLDSIQILLGLLWEPQFTRFTVEMNVSFYVKKKGFMKKKVKVTN